MLRSPFQDVVIPETPVHEEIFKRMREFVPQTALVNAATGQEYTYGQVIDLSKKVSSGLRRLGLRQGDVIAFYMPNLPEFAIVFLGSLAAGATVSTVNPTYTEYELEYHLKDSGSTWLFTIQELLPTVQRAAEKYTKIKRVITANGRVPGCTPLADLFRDDGSHYPSDLKVNPREDVAVIPYSSGTTGVSKGVMLTHYNIMANIEQFGAKDCGAVPPDDECLQVVLAVLPLYHIYGMVAIMLCSLARGSKLVCLPKFEPVPFFEAIQKYKVTLLPVVPPIVIMMCKSPLAAKYDLSSAKYVGCGAAPLNTETEEEFKAKLGVEEINNGYGMTEVSCTASLKGNLKPKKSGSVGFLLPNMEGKIVSTSTGKLCGPNERGELWMRGPNVMKGYLNKPEATRHTLDSDGFLHSGDIGYYDDDGYLFIVDRLKELIKYKGFQVAPAELESLILDHPDVTDVGVIGIPHPEAGEHPKAFVSIRPGSKTVERDIEMHVEKRVAPHKRLRGGVKFVEQIPKSASGKILRRKLAELYANKSKL